MKIIKINNDYDAQSFTTTIDEVVYVFKFVWNYMTSCYAMTITDSLGNYLLAGLHIRGGSELINKYNIGLRNMYLVNTLDSSAELTKKQIGSVGFLVLLDDSEVL